MVLASNRCRAILIHWFRRTSRSACTGVSVRLASMLSSTSRAFSSAVILSGFISLVTYDLLTPYSRATLLFCWPPWTALTIFHRCATVSLFWRWSDPGFALPTFAAPALPPAQSPALPPALLPARGAGRFPALPPTPASAAARRFPFPRTDGSSPLNGCVVMHGHQNEVRKINAWQRDQKHCA